MTEPRIDFDIPQLKGEENLQAWKSMALRVLGVADLDDFIKEDIKKPETEEEIKKWKKNRIMASYLITQSLSLDMQQLLINNGWDQDEQNPKVTWDLILRAVPNITNSMSTLLHEFTHIKRSDFDSLAAHIGRLRVIKTRLEELGCKLPESANIAIALWGLKDAYPRQHDFWIRDFENDTLTWELLAKELTKISNEERTGLRLINDSAVPPAISEFSFPWASHKAL